MNKKFFTLLVALLATISMGVSAQVTVGTAPTTANLVADKYYLLEVNGGTDGYLSVNAGKLVTVASGTLTSYTALQNALWEVTTETGAGTNVVIYRFKNKATETYLAMDKKTFTNTLGGEVSTFISSTGTKTSAAQYFYSYKDASNAAVYGITLNGTDVILKEAIDPATASATPYVTLQPLQVSGTLTLSANDINTYMGRQGVWDIATSRFLAQSDSYIQLSMDPKNTLANPMTEKLQAQGVSFINGSDGLIDTAQPFTFEGAALSYQDLTKEWVALKDVTSGNYLVVDTAYILGTEQFSTPKMQTVTDKWYNTPQSATVKTHKRLADSYVYQFTYNATDNTVSIASKAYRFKPDALDADDGLAEVKTFWTAASAEVYELGETDGNVFLEGQRYDVLDKVPSTATEPTLTLPTPTEAELTAWNKWDRENPYMNYFTFANLAYDGSTMAVVYTWGEEALSIKLDASAWYVQKQLASGVYLLQVVGSRNNANEGKYWKMSLGGTIELVEKATRQNFQHMPSAQWVLDATNNKTASFTNREFANEVLFSVNTTYGVAGAGNEDRFFYLGLDTLKLIPVTAENRANKYLGYYNLEGDEYSYLNRFTFEYLHELLMDQPVATLDDELSTLAVSKNGQPDNYTLVKVGTTNKYGYGHNTLTGAAYVAQLVRDVYRIAIYETLQTEATQYLTYDVFNKKYHLTDKVELASEFLLKENNEVPANGEVNAKCYYTLLEAPVTPIAIGIAATGAAPGDPIVTMIPASEYYLNGAWTLAGGQSYFVAVYDNAQTRWEVAATDAYGVGVIFDYFTVSGNAVSFGGIAPFAPYATSKVSVDNNTLVLTNGVLEDYDLEVANSAFAVKKDNSVLYRTLGLVEGEEVDEAVDGYKIKIFRANATTPEYLYEDANSIYSDSEGEGKGPNKANADRLNIKDQINFLGVEGKGDNIADRAAIIARYVRGTVMPQYLLMLDYEVIAGQEGEPCPICATLPEAERPANCPHDIKPGEGYSIARVLVNLKDSIDAYTSNVDKNKFRWNGLQRLAFVDAIFRAKSKDTNKTFTATDAYMTLAGKDIEYQVKFPAVDTPKEGLHTEYLHAFRLIDNRYDKALPASYNDFLIETSRESEIANAYDFWIKVQNGVPVLSPETSFNEAIISGAERWNLEATTDASTSNTGIEAGAVKVIAGTGAVTIKGAAGQQVTIANILGQTVYTGVVSADEVTIAAPAGVVVVSVAGEATKALVK